MGEAGLPPPSVITIYDSCVKKVALFTTIRIAHLVVGFYRFRVLLQI